MPIRYRAVTALGQDTVLERIRSMPTEIAHESYIASSGKTILGSIFVRSSGNVFQFSESAGLTTLAVGEGIVKPNANGCELLVSFSFGLFPQYFFLLLALVLFVASLLVFAVFGIEAAMFGIILVAACVIRYVQKMMAVTRMIDSFSSCFSGDLEWEEMR